MDNIPERFRLRIQEAKEKQLEELDLSNEWNADDKDKLTEIPAEVFELTRLKFLKLNYNSISELPESLSNLNNLTQLDLSGNNLSNLPEFLGNLTNLTHLGLGNSHLSKIPEFLGNLSNLVCLDLWKSQLSEVPEFLGSLTSLTYLDLSRNDLSELPDTLNNLTNLTSLYLGGNKLLELPDFLGNLTNLTEIHLWNSHLSTLPEFFGKLTNLNKLYLHNNQLSELPEFLGKLTNLTELVLSTNYLSELPEFLGELTNLNTLYLWRNPLSELPQSLGKLTKLENLDLSETKISILPVFLKKLTNLKNLYVANNNLLEIPDSLGELINLDILSLEGNQLSELPASLGNLTNSTKLYLYGNPLVKPPIEIANQGIEAIRDYFQQIKAEGSVELQEAKLLILGEGGAGKTSLAQKIRSKDYQLKEEDSTQGIDVLTWNFPTVKGHNFRVNIWDFGGQEIYHATHQFFLTKRSLYALVADNRREDTDFYYWLNVVELLSDNSPLLIIKNEKQDRQKDINETALRGQFTNLEKTLATNLATNRGLEEILTDIKHYIQKLPHIGQVLPKTWENVRQVLEQDSRNHITLQEYLNICDNNQITRRENKFQLSKYLHDLGVCLHFQDEEDSLLYKTVILKPEWGTDAVYKVLDNKQVINNQGEFTRNDLKNIWCEEKYLSMRGELLELMKKFQLCYEIPGNKNTFIAPQLLTNNQPEYEWHEEQNLILRYTYHNFMPKGIISRFIVVMHHFIDDQKYVWRTGVILKQDDTKAEVIEYYGSREIKIRVAGKNKRNFLTIITHELDKINNSFNRLKYEKLIPCNCKACKDSKNPFAYDFNKLLERYSNNKLTIECGNPPYDDVQVLSLIDNAIDIKKLVPEGKRDYHKSFNIKGDIQQLILQLAEQGNKNIMSNTNQYNSGSGDNLASNQGDIIKQQSGSFGVGVNKGKINAQNLAGIINQSQDENQKLIEQIRQQIQTLENQEMREEALEYVEDLETEISAEKPKKSKLKSSLTMLWTVGKDVALVANALTSLAANFGVSLP